MITQIGIIARFVWCGKRPEPTHRVAKNSQNVAQLKGSLNPEVEDALGNLTVSRETGLMPIPMHPGDKIRLDGQEGLVLIVTAESVANDPRDGHNFHVVTWSGIYEGTESGTASGAIIDQGPLKGLISSVSRVLQIPFGEKVIRLISQKRNCLRELSLHQW